MLVGCEHIHRPFGQVCLILDDCHLYLTSTTERCYSSKGAAVYNYCMLRWHWRRPWTFMLPCDPPATVLSRPIPSCRASKIWRFFVRHRNEIAKIPTYADSILKMLKDIRKTVRASTKLQRGSTVFAQFLDEVRLQYVRRTKDTYGKYPIEWTPPVCFIPFKGLSWRNYRAVQVRWQKKNWSRYCYRAVVVALYFSSCVGYRFNLFPQERTLLVISRCVILEVDLPQPWY